MTDSESRLLKSIFVRRRRFIIGLGLLSSFLLGVWLILPFLLERYAVLTIRDFGFGEVSLKVEDLGPWGTTISDASLADEKTSLSINEVVVRYQPTKVMDGRFHALTLDQPELRIDLKAWLKGLASSADPSGGNKKNLEEAIRAFIREPVLNRFRLRESKATLLWDNYSATAGMNALMRAGNDFLYLDLNGSLLETPVSAIASISGGSDGVGFALPAERVISIANEIIKYGEVNRAWIGDFKFKRGYYNLDNTKIPALFVFGIDNSNIENGLKDGDIILEVKGVEARWNVLKASVNSILPGEILELKVDRNGEIIILEIITRERPNIPPVL